jgi:hypothetical protein
VAPDSAPLIAAIYNAAYMVRYYARGGRTQIHRSQRQEAIRQLGLICRDAFNRSDEFEALLTAIFDGLSPKDAPPF